MSIEAFSLDQFQVLVAVVDTGSFSGAARRLGRAASAVTYAIRRLEEQSGVTIFDRSSYRPALTEAGRALLPRARRILDDLADYRLQAQGIGEGLEAEVSVVVDSLAPMARIAAALKAMQHAYPQVQVRITVESIGACVPVIASGHAGLGVISRASAMQELEHDRCFGVELVAVAAPDHPLGSLPGRLSPEAMRDHVQIVLTGRQPLPGNKDHGVQSINQWRVTELGTKHALLIAGVGWGSMPRHAVQADLDRGALVQLRPARWEGADSLPQLDISAAWRRDRPLGPAARLLVERLKQEAAAH